MSSVSAIAVPPDSLLAGFGGPQSYRDCFAREAPGAVTLPEFVERFYTSAAFLPERIILKLLGRKASRADASRIAQGEAEAFGAWKLIERRDAAKGGRAEMLLESRETGTASWFAVEPLENGTRLLFGSWVGQLDQSGWRFMERAHMLYSRLLLGAV